MPSIAVATVDSKIRLEGWLVKPNEWLETGTPVAIAYAETTRFLVTVNGPGVIGRILREPGALVTPGEAIAVVYADGESIPYGRPYSVARLA
jgi:pyruvate/2-oxoglutarate dehydrogenase complex dihydrolipoamide acyltransferase (E2) component